MATRRSKKVNKRFTKVNEEWPDKDGTSANKNNTRKRKLSDLLGSQWSKEELERFYESYRKHGKDWRKVAATIRNRSIEMVEALYNMNRAYLSLAEGTASAAGLIAMMTDHYNNLEGSDSERESIDVQKISRKPQKRGRGKFRRMSKGADGQFHESSPSSYGCLSLLKGNHSGDLLAGSRPRVVGKRTPRVPISNTSVKDYKDKIVSPNKQGLKSVTSADDDEGVHVAALALAEAFQRGESPHVSRTPGTRSVHMRSSPVTNSARKKSATEKVNSKSNCVQMDDNHLEGSLGSREAENVDFARGVESADVFENMRRVKNLQGNLSKSGGIEKNEDFDDETEACSGTEESITRRRVKEEIGIEDADGTSARPSSGRKRSRKLFFGDESSSFDALQTLADLSVNILLPSNIESESSIQVKEEKNVDNDEKHGMPESMSPNHQRNKSKTPEKNRIPSTVIASDVVTRKNATVKVSSNNTNAASEIKQQTCKTITKVQKSKRKLLQGKLQIRKAECNNDAQSSGPQKTKVLVEERRSIGKVTRRNQVTPISKHEKFIKSQEGPTSTDLRKPETDLTETTVQAPENQVSPLTKILRRRKLSLEKALASNMLKPNNNSGDDSIGRFLHLDNEELLDFEDMLSHCLSSPLLRRWCVFEWFYSAIDYPWFAKNEFVEYLTHVQLGHVPRLTRVEWGVIRSSLGKPRRFSRKFLEEEREKLEQYRESVRTHYAELRAGVKDGLPTDLAQPLSVGQRVIAYHAKMGTVHDGSILTVDHNRNRVQFDLPELGVEFVMDIDCMPLNPSENLPESFRRHNNFMETKLDASSYPMNTLLEQSKGNTIDAIVQAKAAVNEAAVATQESMYSRPGTLEQMQAREADIRALAELARALDKKEALLVELRHMNEEVSGTQDSEPVKDLHFRKQYAIILLQLRDTNDQVSSALLYLSQRNTYHGNSTPTMLNNNGNLAPSVLLNNDSGSHVTEVIHSSRQKARMIVDTAVRAMCDLKEDEDAFVRVGQALDSADIRNCGTDRSIPPIRYTPEPGHDSSSFQNRTASCKTEPVTVHALSPKSPLSCDANEVQLPIELISSCVATLYMIRSCTERQYPPAEVAHILDAAVMSLQPRCPQNLPIYREIESCMGIIKNQMLARIPTLTTVLPAESPV